MEVYALTELGRKIAKTKNGDDEELKVLQFMKERKTVTNSELDGFSESYIVKHLIREGLVKKLTS